MRKTVLIVDDDPDCLRILEDFLTHVGFGVVVAHDARSAYRMLAREALEPDVLIVDLAMPGMDGGSFIEALRQNPLVGQPPIFVISAFGEAEAPSPSGVKARFMKPLDLEALEHYLTVL